MANKEYRDGVNEGLREGYWTIGKIIPMGILIMILLYGLGFLVTGGDLFIYKFFAPKQEQIKYDVFKNTQAFSDGMVEELQQYMIDYNKSTPEHKQVLASVILRQAAKIDEKKLPQDLRDFIDNLKQAK